MVLSGIKYSTKNIMVKDSCHDKFGCSTELGHIYFDFLHVLKKLDGDVEDLVQKQIDYIGKDYADFLKITKANVSVIFITEYFYSYYQ